ncbi:MAG: protein kinase domain-containing protein [Gemmatimonadales bacterium]
MSHSGTYAGEVPTRAPKTHTFDGLQAALAGRYALLRELGAGGLATVYLAEDLRHHRKVAVKVLRPELAATLGPDRFVREIEVAAGLQHPHILAMLDSGEAGGFLWYVMPYVEGESLRDRIAHRGELPVTDAVRILAEVADALAYAHSKGVVHRDIKPDNVLLSSRHALVADFGVAKAVGEAADRQTLTTAGVALGTPTYMAPEQAAADPQVDHRADIYAFGVLAYELLTGTPPFTGGSAAMVLAAHMTRLPTPVGERRPGLPPVLAEVVMRALAKRPADRWQSAQEIVDRLELLGAASVGTTPAQTRPMAAARRRSRALLVGIAGAAIALGGIALFAARHREPVAFTVGRRTAVTRDPGLELYPALSPDGKLLAYTATRGGELKIFVRQADGGTPVALTDQVPGQHVAPAWSPDGTTLLFSSLRGVETIPALGGQVRLLLDAAVRQVRSGFNFRIASWSPDGRSIAFVRNDSIFVRAVAGGAERALATRFGADAPVWSRDGEWIAYTAGNPDYVFTGNVAPSALWVVPSGGGESIPITDDRSLNLSPAWAAGRTLLWVSDRDGGRDVFQVALDRRGRLAGDPVRITTGLNAQTISLAADGRRLAYSAYAETSNVHLIRMLPDRSRPVSEATAITSGNQIIETADVSRDGRWLVFDSDRAGRHHLFRVGLPSGTPEQLTADSADDFAPVFSPDGREIAFHRIEHGVRDIFVLPAEGGRAERVTTRPEDDRIPRWTPDGQALIYQCDVGQSAEVCAVARGPQGWGAPRQLTRDGGLLADVAPDGQRIVYRSAGLPGQLMLMSIDGGPSRRIDDSASGNPGPLWPRWASDGRTVIYEAFQGTRFSARVARLDGGPTREVLHVNDPTSQTHRFGIVVRGDSLFFTLVDRQADIWVAEVRDER